MSVRRRKPVRVQSGRRGADLRRDVREAIDRIWPEGIVEPVFDVDESYFFDLHAKLSKALWRIGNTRPTHEREADKSPDLWDESDPDEYPPDDIDGRRTYHTFFISPAGEAFTFEAEAEELVEPDCMTGDFAEADWEEELPMSAVAGSGTTGWMVAVSLLAPFAVIELSHMIVYDDGTVSEPQIEFHGQTEDGDLIDPEQAFREAHGARPYQTLVRLRSRIAGILERFGIGVLPAEEWRKPVPWLRGSEEALIGRDGMAVRVLDAFFFEML